MTVTGIQLDKRSLLAVAVAGWLDAWMAVWLEYESLISECGDWIHIYIHIIVIEEWEKRLYRIGKGKYDWH